MSGSETLRSWLRAEVLGVLKRRVTPPPLVLWCDPEGAWRDLLKAAAQGGGFELWISRFIAMYSEMTLAQVKGSPAGGGEGGIDNRATLIVGGIRVRLGL